MAIKILSKEVAAKIAAGEVVERPASVVKELIENAIDAGANNIGVSIEQAGLYSIEVVDDGCGIPRDEIPLALERYATSKIQSAEDLFSLKTLGFRGEALASIAAVARLIISSRKAQEKFGSRIVTEHGLIEAIENYGGVEGTVVRVEHLFANIPARLKFLKTDQYEKRLIVNLLEKYVIAYPSISFHFSIDGKKVFDTSGNGAQREVLMSILGFQNSKLMLDVAFEEDGTSVFGFVSPPGLTRSNRREITFFINGRWIQDVALGAALIRAYHTYLMVGRYPIAWLFLQIPPAEVDINVHPTKAEVRLKNPDRIFSLVQRAVRFALMNANLPRFDNEPKWRFAPEATGDVTQFPNMANQDSLPTQGDPENAEKSRINNQFTQSEIKSTIPLLRLIGQIGATYLVAEGPDGLYLIDQHAAHERILYEQLNNHQKSLSSQILLEPVVLRTRPEEGKQIEQIIAEMEQIGFVVERFGINTLRVTGVPSVIKSLEIESALNALFEPDIEDPFPTNEPEKILIMRICKKLAIKAGQVLSITEQEKLLHELENCALPRTCPHGRPTMIHISVDLLERQFGRRGSL